jgi:YD repeat-containing protein
MYDHLGHLVEIQYTNGKRIKVAYNEMGRVQEVTGDGRKKARLGKDVPTAPAGQEKLGSLLAVQEGMEAMEGDRILRQVFT